MSTTTTITKQSKNILLSKKGFKELKKEIAQLEHDIKTTQRSLREGEKTNGHDDRFERNEKLLRLEALEGELYDKQQVLLTAKLIPSKRARIKVAIGSVVDLIDQQGTLFRYTIVDSIEANPSDGRISTSSPLGSTLLGKNVEDKVEWGSGHHYKQFKLVKIS